MAMKPRIARKPHSFLQGAENRKQEVKLIVLGRRKEPGLLSPGKNLPLQAYYIAGAELSNLHLLFHLKSPNNPLRSVLRCCFVGEAILLRVRSFPSHPAQCSCSV